LIRLGRKIEEEWNRVKYRWEQIKRKI
jgi:hypothetical protein